MNEIPEILDACCGGRMWWWDKEHPLAVYMDKKVADLGSRSAQPGWSSQPSVIGDFRSMPFEGESFNLIVFDPPHIVQKARSGEFLATYGAFESKGDLNESLGRGFQECWRVLRKGGTLVFKWSGDPSTVTGLFPSKPVVGTRQLRQRGGARWYIFYKPQAQP